MKNEILQWVENKINNTNVSIKLTNISKSDFWFYDLYNGRIINRKNSFFSIYGAEYIYNDTYIVEQPIIIQNEIGYLGIICKIIDGMPFFYMQAKIEPGNINVVQISPTIQATKSNFTRAHGGSLPKFFDVFEMCRHENIVYDQIQPEQSTRFYHKYNRNLIVKYDDCILNDDDNFKWIPYNVLIELFSIDNLINMDTRTVISGLPYDLIDKNVINKYWYKSIYSNEISSELNRVFHLLGNYTMFNTDRTVLKPLYELRDWNITDDGIYCKRESNFDVKYYDILINGREVQSWSQPLFCSKGGAVFGLIIKKFSNEYKILISIRKYIGSNTYEMAPTVQLEYTEIEKSTNSVDCVFFKYLKSKNNIVRDVVLSEEGGRFYHEQNRNVIVEISEDIVLPEGGGYCYISLGTLKKLINMTQIVNIQLRNLVSIINIFD